MRLLLIALVLISAPVQAAITTALFRDPLAAPVLPVILVAAWATVRGADETWPAILLPAIVLGATSEERVGWFLIALLPSPAVAVIAVRQIRPRVTGIGRRAIVASSVAALGTLAYASILSLAGGVGSELDDSAAAILVAMIASAILAGVVAIAMWPLRPHERGLFT